MTTTTEPEPSTHPEPAPKPRSLRRRVLSRISIQSKLLVMLLVTSILSAAVVGSIGYQSGRSSLRAAVFDRLTEIRASQSRQLESKYQDLQDSLIVYTRGATTTEAIEAFTAGFDQLNDCDDQPGAMAVDRRLLQQPVRKVRSRSRPATASTSTRCCRRRMRRNTCRRTTPLPFDDWDKAIRFDDARDGSAWSAANARFNDFFREIVLRFEFEDALLLDTRGNVVYTAYKGVDLGTNILTGPYREGGLRDAYQKAMASNAVDYVGVTDFGDYQPADEPTAWMVSPVGPQGRVEGVLALQFPISKINRLMTADRQWEAAGMGKTGETFLVGPDGLMRSDSRLFLENPEEFKRDVVDAGTPPERCRGFDPPGRHHAGAAGGDRGDPAGPARPERHHDRGRLPRPRDAAGVRAGKPAGLNWSIIAKIDTAEAFAPVAAFTRTLVLSTAVIIFVVCLAAMLLARLFVRPIRRLEAGAQQISSGDYHVTLPVQSRDEFGDLTVAFNDMSRNLAIKEELLAEQRRENDRLLLSLMPEPVVQRYREGEETIAQDHQNVTVIFADIVGLDELAAELSSDELLAIVNKLTRQFDAAAENLGVEQVRTLHNGYLASCGMSVPRLDNVRRTVDFAIEMQRIVDRFNTETGNDLKLRAGIDTGTVTSGLGRALDAWPTTCGGRRSISHTKCRAARRNPVYTSRRLCTT